MDGGSSLNLIYQDTISEMGIDPTKICHSNTTLKGVMPGRGAHCTGSLLLKVIFGFPDNSRSRHLTFHIALVNAVVKHYLDAKLLLALMQYRITLPSRSRCPNHAASLQ